MTEKDDKMGRRGFVGGALGAAAGVGVASMLGQSQAQAQPPGGGAPPQISPNFARPSSSFKLESTIYDCDVEGDIPSDLNGAFYRVGPDPQYPLAPGNIPFDGEGHV
ncbi:MAG: carotenoid oxygenase family protein, partial [Gammaproteobacteria bacterium]